MVRLDVAIQNPRDISFPSCKDGPWRRGMPLFNHQPTKSPSRDIDWLTMFSFGSLVWMCSFASLHFFLLVRLPPIGVSKAQSWDFWENDGNTTGTWTPALTGAVVCYWDFYILISCRCVRLHRGRPCLQLTGVCVCAFLTPVLIRDIIFSVKSLVLALGAWIHLYHFYDFLLDGRSV